VLAKEDSSYSGSYAPHNERLMRPVLMLMLLLLLLFMPPSKPILLFSDTAQLHLRRFFPRLKSIHDLRREVIFGLFGGA